MSIDRKDFDRFWNLFVYNLQYFIHCYFGKFVKLSLLFLNHQSFLFSFFAYLFLDKSSLILSHSWQILAKYYTKSRTSLSSNSEQIQQKLKLLPWNRYVPTLEDIKLMFEASQQECCPPVILISHILYTVNWNSCVQSIAYQDISQSMEWLTHTIIMLVDKPEMLSLNDLPIHLMNSVKAASICRMLRHRIKLDLYLIKITDRTAMWINIIKIICGIEMSEESQAAQVNQNDLNIKKLIYVETFCGLITDALKSDPKFVKDNESKFINYLKSCLDDVKLSLKIQSDHRVKVLTIIAKFINNLNNCDIDTVNSLTRVILSKLENDKTVILEMITCCCQSITNSLTLLVQIVERCLHIFADLDGQIIEVVPIFSIAYPFDNTFFQICYQYQAYQTMTIFYQCKKSTKNTIPLLSELTNWSCQLKPM